MYIKSLELNNFKNHSHLKLEFSSKLNVLYGENDLGKSNIIKAIKWVYFNEGKDIRKEGTKKTSVKVTHDNGVTVEKIRSASTNAYILYKDGEEKKFDAVGKTIPEEIQNALQVRTIKIGDENIILNIADQKEVPFLLGMSSTFRSKVFNKLTGSDLIDKALQSFNKDILRIGRETKLETEHLKEQQKSLEEVTQQKDKLESLYGNFKNQFNNLKVLQERYEKASNLKDELESNYCDLQETNALLSNIKIVSDDLVTGLKKDIEKLERYEGLINKLKEFNIELEKTNKQLKEIKVVDIDISGLQNNINKIEKIKQLNLQLTGNKQLTEELEKKLKEISKQIVEENKQYKEMLRKYGKCPTCQSNITEDILKDIKL